MISVSGTARRRTRSAATPGATASRRCCCCHRTTSSSTPPPRRRRRRRPGVGRTSLELPWQVPPSCTAYAILNHLHCRHLLPSESFTRKRTIASICLPLRFLFQVLHSSSVELSHYFPFLFKFILLVYAILCLGELLHRWSNGCFLNLWCA